MSTYLGIPRPSAFILQFKFASLGENKAGNGTHKIIGIPKVRWVRTFVGGDSGQLQRDFIEFVEETAWDADGKCCNGVN